MEEYSYNLVSLLIAPHFQIGCGRWKTDEASLISCPNFHLYISIFSHITSEILEFVHILYVLAVEIDWWHNMLFPYCPSLVLMQQREFLYSALKTLMYFSGMP